MCHLGTHSDSRMGLAECSGAGPSHPGGLSPQDRIPFTLSQLAVFCLVARTSSFRSCALALSISQPAVSKSLAAFERVSCHAQ